MPLAPELDAAWAHHDTVPVARDLDAALQIDSYARQDMEACLPALDTALQTNSCAHQEADASMPALDAALQVAHSPYVYEQCAYPSSQVNSSTGYDGSSYVAEALPSAAASADLSGRASFARDASPQAQPLPAKVSQGAPVRLQQSRGNAHLAFRLGCAHASCARS